MKSARKNYLSYILMLIATGALGLFIVARGERLYHTVPSQAPAAANDAPFRLFSASLGENVGHPLSLLLLQIIAILIAVRIFSFIFKYLGQPGVIGEIVAGIALGPSVLGYFFPETFGFLFSAGSLVPLHIISQIGLILFMFVIGMELDIGIIRKKASETLFISHSSIFFPFLLGIVMAYFVYPEFGAGQTPFLSFALFIGISISITALPVLARILQERNLAKTNMGMLTIASAANNDITAWCMLAAIIAIVHAGSAASALFTLLASAAYILFMFLVVRPFMRKLGEIYNTQEVLNKTLVSFIFLVLVLSSFITEVLGIHALFGAFVAGLIMPSNINFRRVMSEKVEDVALVLFLPLFFVFTGLRTEIGALDSPHLWGICAIFIAVSIAGKMIGTIVPARMTGESWKDSLSMGVLMNTRGLMELIILNIGYELGIIPSSIFVIFVIMALFTTFMATPSLALIEKYFRKKRPVGIHRKAYPRILLSFGNPQSGAVFLSLLDVLFRKKIARSHITALHFTIGTDTSPLDTDEFYEKSFSPILAQARKLGLQVHTRYEVTDRYAKDLLNITRNEAFDFVIVGGGVNFIRDSVERPRNNPLQMVLFRVKCWLSRKECYLPGGMLRDKTRVILNKTDTPTGVFINKKFGAVNRIGMIVASAKELPMLHMAAYIADGTELSILSLDNHHNAAQLRAAAESLSKKTERTVALSDQTPGQFAAANDLVILSHASWQQIVQRHATLIPHLPSFLVVKG